MGKASCLSVGGLAGCCMESESGSFYSGMDPNTQHAAILLNCIRQKDALYLVYAPGARWYREIVQSPSVCKHHMHGGVGLSECASGHQPALASLRMFLIMGAGSF